MCVFFTYLEQEKLKFVTIGLGVGGFSTLLVISLLVFYFYRRYRQATVSMVFRKNHFTMEHILIIQLIVITRNFYEI